MGYIFNAYILLISNPFHKHFTIASPMLQIYTQYIAITYEINQATEATQLLTSFII